MRGSDFVVRTSLGKCLGAVLAVLFVVSCLVEGMIGSPSAILRRASEREELLGELQRRQALWHSAEAGHYRVTVENMGYTFYWLICSSATLEVKDGVMISFEGAGKSTQWCEGIYSGLTVDEIFLLAREYVLRDDPLRVKIDSLEYDETFGFIRRLGVRVEYTLFDNVFGPWLYPDRLMEINPVFFEIRSRDFQPLD